MLKKLTVAAAVVIAVVLALSFTGCFNAGEKLAEKAMEKVIEAAGDEGLDINIEEGEMNIKDDDGGETQIGEGASLPDGWPGDVAVYPDLKIVLSSKNSDSEGKVNWGVTGEITNGTVKEVYEWYKSKMGSGWEVTTDSFSTSDGNDSAYLSLANSSYDVLIILGESDDTISLTVAVTEK